MGDDGQKFGGSIYQAINPKLEYGIMAEWSKSNGGGGDSGGDGGNEGDGGGEGGDSNGTIAAGCQFQLDPETSVRVKVDSNRLVGLGYCRRLREGKCFYFCLTFGLLYYFIYECAFSALAF